MSFIINDGSHVNDTFASAFKTLVNGLAKANEPVNFYLNVQDGESIRISCSYSYAYEHISFIDALDAEILAHGVAIVTANDYRNDARETTLFVVCDDEL